MSLGMIGIISIQYFWIKNALDLRKVQFNRAVLTAMNEVTHKLQKEQAYKRFERIKSLNSQVKVDSLGNLHVAYSDASTQMIFIGDEDSVQEFVDEKINIHVSLKELEVDEEALDEEMEGQEDSLQNQLKILNDKLDEKYILYEQLLKDLNEFEYYTSIEERIDGQLLNEELKTAFDAHGSVSNATDS